MYTQNHQGSCSPRQQPIAGETCQARITARASHACRLCLLMTLPTHNTKPGPLPTLTHKGTASPPPHRLQGVGRATALLFARKGYNVVVAAREPSRLQYVASEVAALAGRQGAALAVPCDVTSERDVKALVNATLSKFDSVDVVVSCAGAVARGAFLDMPIGVGARARTFGVARGWMRGNVGAVVAH